MSDTKQRFFESKIKKVLLELRSYLTIPAHAENVGLWCSAVVAGLSAVAYAKAFRISEQIFHSIIAVNPAYTFLITPVACLAAWYAIRRYSPEAAGSGIPQVMAANETKYEGVERARVDRLLSVRVIVVKTLSSLLCVLGGGAIGREGPTLQISASIFHLFGKITRRFVPMTNEHTWIVAGAAAGLASAFNTPLGGIVYAIEELGLVQFHKVRTALLGGVIASGLVAQWLLGTYLYIGFPELTQITFSFLPIAILNGVTSGFCGAVFGKALFALVKYRRKIQKQTHLALLALVMGLLMATFIFFDQRAAGTGIEVISDLLFRHEHSSPGLIAGRFFGTMVAYLTGAAGGIFSPSLSIGASIGSQLAWLLSSGHENMMVLLGMIGFLTGVTRTPFTSFILVLEMTDHHSAIFPMMLAAMTAQWISQLVDSKSFYEHVKDSFKAPEADKAAPSAH